MAFTHLLQQTPPQIQIHLAQRPLLLRPRLLLSVQVHDEQQRIPDHLHHRLNVLGAKQPAHQEATHAGLDARGRRRLASRRLLKRNPISRVGCEEPALSGGRSTAVASAVAGTPHTVCDGGGRLMSGHQSMLGSCRSRRRCRTIAVVIPHVRSSRRRGLLRPLVHRQPIDHAGAVRRDLLDQQLLLLHKGRLQALLFGRLSGDQLVHLAPAVHLHASDQLHNVGTVVRFCRGGRGG